VTHSAAAETIEDLLLAARQDDFKRVFTRIDNLANLPLTRVLNSFDFHHVPHRATKEHVKSLRIGHLLIKIESEYADRMGIKIKVIFVLLLANQNSLKLHL
jgi:hypothetical protein